MASEGPVRGRAQASSLNQSSEGMGPAWLQAGEAVLSLGGHGRVFEG